jgi:hypothetical protein
MYYDYTSLEFLTGPGPATNNKTFVIDHPDDPEKHLVHACLEGPEAGVYYRGKTLIEPGKDSVEVLLPEYTKKLAYDYTVSVTPIGKPRVYGASEIVNSSFEIYGGPGVYHWMVHAKRGEVQVEPRKDSVVVKGDGPYKYL